MNTVRFGTAGNVLPEHVFTTDSIPHMMARSLVEASLDYTQVDPLSDQDTAACATAVVVQDYTDRQRARRAMINSEYTPNPEVYERTRMPFVLKYIPRRMRVPAATVAVLAATNLAQAAGPALDWIIKPLDWAQNQANQTAYSCVVNGADPDDVKVIGQLCIEPADR